MAAASGPSQDLDARTPCGNARAALRGEACDQYVGISASLFGQRIRRVAKDTERYFELGDLRMQSGFGEPPEAARQRVAVGRRGQEMPLETDVMDRDAGELEPKHQVQQGFEALVAVLGADLV